MIKIQTLIALSAVAALAATANAQTSSDNGDGVHLKPAPGFGPLLRPPITPSPQLDLSQPQGIRLKVLKSPDGEILQVEAGKQSIGDVLQKIADVMGVKVVIDPELQKETHASLFFRGKDFDDLLNSISQAMNIEMVKSPADTYFFAAKPARAKGPTLYYQMPDGTYKRSDNLSPGGGLRIIPRPFEPSEKLPRIDPDFTWPKNFGTIQPLPNWEKREFNGNPFYHIPLPIPVPNSPDGIYILPMPQPGNAQ